MNTIIEVLNEYNIPESIYRNGKIYLDELDNEETRMMLQLYLSCQEFLLGI